MSSTMLLSQSRNHGLRLNRHSHRHSHSQVGAGYGYGYGCAGQARTVSSTAERKKAIPFTFSSAAQLERDEKGKGEKLRMIMFGKPGAGKVRPVFSRLSSAFSLHFIFVSKFGRAHFQIDL